MYVKIHNHGKLCRCVLQTANDRLTRNSKVIRRSYFNVLFSRVNEQHCYRTRQSLMDITLCRFKTMYGRRSFRYSGALLWNKLPLDIKDISSMVSFSLKTKSWLLSRLFC